MLQELFKEKVLIKKVVIIKHEVKTSAYPIEVPFLPNEVYIELKGHLTVGKERNITYELFRQLLFNLGFDIKHFGTPNWNPLGELIKPGQKVLIKPNLVRHIHLNGGDYNAVVTHGSLVRCVLDYVALALNGEGEITVGDAPVQSADWYNILERTGLQAICEDVSKRWNIPVRLIDFRLWSVELDDKHRIIKGNKLKGDPEGYVPVDLGKQSLLSPLDHQYERFRVTNYDYRLLREHHNPQKHEYLIPKSILNADVVINIPKLKTHRKVGLTGALKNMVGINGHKDWLPHHRVGSIKEGGDEYLHPSLLKKVLNKLDEKTDVDSCFLNNSGRRFAGRILSQLVKYFSLDPYLEGSWYGNDTLWRTVLDLNRLIIYADKAGVMTEIPQRKFLNIVDAIVAGEGEGPMEPDSRPLGILIGGANPVSVDAVLATLVGFDYKKIPLINNAFNIQKWPLVDFKPEEIEIHATDSKFKFLKLGNPFKEFCFKPPSGWYGHIEM